MAFLSEYQGPDKIGHFLERCYDVSYAHNMFNCDHCYWVGTMKDSQWCINCLENENLY